MSEPNANAIPPDAGVAALNATFCAVLADEWVRSGVTDVVVAPGSRSTPITLALATRPELTVHVHQDERSAAFTALGVGRATGRPAVVVTTSGTAAVELHPAVVEAHQAGVPLIVATADRPPELHDVGAPQTVDQTHLFGRSVRWFVEPGPPVADAAPTWRSLASRAWNEAVHGPAGPGPVHLNLGFREPLAGTPLDLPVGRADGAPWHAAVGTNTSLDDAGIDRLARLLDRPRGVIVAGAGCGSVSDVAGFAQATGWPILADARSGCRGAGVGAIGHADPLLRDAAFAERMRPEVVLRLGEPPASKVVGTWLRSSGADQVAIVGDGRWYDPDRGAAAVVRVEPGAALRALAGALTHDHDDDWAGAWAAADVAAAAAVDDLLAGHRDATEPAVARALCSALPADATLVVSSSMPIRDVEWFGGGIEARVLANRGANGIDGVVSTAVGAALAARGSGRRTVALVGDLAFVHDTNALLGLVRRGVDLTIVVVDNDGGGIFSFLPQAEALEPERFERLFGTPHGADLLALAAAHGIDAESTSSIAGFTTRLAHALDVGGVRVLRIETDRAENVAVHDDLNAGVAAALRNEMGTHPDP